MNHDPSAALVVDGRVVAVAEEERFNRVKTGRGYLPARSIATCLRTGGLTLKDIDLVASTGETVQEELSKRIGLFLQHYFGDSAEVICINHQLAHAASAYFCSDFDDAMVLSYDGWGDRISSMLAVGTGGGLKVLETRPAENSLGTFYSTMTSFLGFRPLRDEYKVMGLAAYGEPGIDLSAFACPTATGYNADPAFTRRTFPVRCFDEPSYSSRLVELLGDSRRPDAPIEKRHKDLAFATQETLERCAVSLVRYLHQLTGFSSLCLAGGIALNCRANAALLREDFVQRLFVQPAASDRGLALGAAQWISKTHGATLTRPAHAFMGPAYTDREIENALKLAGLSFTQVEDPAAEAARRIADGAIVAWFHGRSEHGPRALGHRSILADPRQPAMKDKINARIKFREEFRPFAPAVLEECAADLFLVDAPSPFMTITYPVRDHWKDRLGAVTHVDGTARIQTVNAEHAPMFHRLISHFRDLTGVPTVLNTSFNARGEPIVETPADAVATFSSVGLDDLFIGPFHCRKPRPRNADDSR